MLELRDRVVMVAGASGGLGRAITAHLSENGALVSAGLRRPRGLAEGDRLMPHRYDAESPDSAAAWMDATLRRFGRVQALVNAAGINPHVGVLDADEAALDALWLVNVKAPMRLIRLVLPHLMADGAGRVVNVASLSGKRVRNANAGYAMSKFALVALTHAVRQAGWDRGVRATALCPGFVATDMTAGVTKVPRDAMSKPEDIAALVGMILRLPNTASVAELLVNCQREDML